MWGTVGAPTDGSAGSAGPATPLATVDASSSPTLSTGVPELDRVLGGGLVPGSVTLLGGEPGIGKSTLLLQVLMACDAPCILVCAEESVAQVKQRAARLGTVPDGLLVLAETSLPAIRATLAACRPTLCVVDSIQTISDPEVDSVAGSVTQVRACAQSLARWAKDTGGAVCLVGHVTKDGSLAGPRALEHLVDTVLSFEGDRHQTLRTLAAMKHRFGPTGELGLFEMTEHGMRGVEDPSALLLGDRRLGLAGSAVVPALEGRRSILTEIQALVCTGNRRTSQGIDGRRLAVLLAVLDKRAGFHMADLEVFVSAVGGLRLTEPAVDLAIAMALASAVFNMPLPDDLAVFGEVGLGGELRQVPHGARRLAEAARLGFGQALVPASVASALPAGTYGLKIRPVSTVSEAVAALSDMTRPAPSITKVAV